MGDDFNLFLVNDNLRESRALDAMIDVSITKVQYNSKVKEINNMLIKLNDELVTSKAISKKKNTIREKLTKFSKMTEKETNLKNMIRMYLKQQFIK